MRQYVIAIGRRGGRLYETWTVLIDEARLAGFDTNIITQLSLRRSPLGHFHKRERKRAS